MSENVTICDALTQAAEYLCKLGSNLKIRSENVIEKRISKHKLKRPQGIQKAVEKMLLICDLSKKSLDNVENTILKIINSSQAGPKTPDEASPNYHVFEYKGCKLRITKKIKLSWFTSAIVLVEQMSLETQDRYPLHYDCKLFQTRKLKKREKENFKTHTGTIKETNKTISIEQRKRSILSGDSDNDTEHKLSSECGTFKKNADNMANKDDADNLKILDNSSNDPYNEGSEKSISFLGTQDKEFNKCFDIMNSNNLKKMEKGSDSQQSKKADMDKDLKKGDQAYNEVNSDTIANKPVCLKSDITQPYIAHETKTDDANLDGFTSPDNVLEKSVKEKTETSDCLKTIKDSTQNQTNSTKTCKESEKKDSIISDIVSRQGPINCDSEKNQDNNPAELKKEYVEGKGKESKKSEEKKILLKCVDIAKLKTVQGSEAKKTEAEERRVGETKNQEANKNELPLKPNAVDKAKSDNENTEINEKANSNELQKSNQNSGLASKEFDANKLINTDKQAEEPSVQTLEPPPLCSTSPYKQTQSQNAKFKEPERLVKRKFIVAPRSKYWDYKRKKYSFFAPRPCTVKIKRMHDSFVPILFNDRSVKMIKYKGTAVLSMEEVMRVDNPGLIFKKIDEPVFEKKLSCQPSIVNKNSPLKNIKIKRKISQGSAEKKSKRKNIMESMHAKKMLLTYSSSSDTEDEQLRGVLKEIKDSLMKGITSSDDEKPNVLQNVIEKHRRRLLVSSSSEDDEVKL